MSAYDRDLAFVHDEGFGGFAERSAPGLLAMLRDHSIARGHVVDLGCGSGIWAGVLTDSGYSVTGYDLSPAMITLARKRAPKGRFIRGSFFDVDIPPADAVTSLGECLSYRFEANNRTSRRRLFRRVYDALRPGGLFITDVATTGIEARYGGQPRLWWGGDEWVLCTRYEGDERSLTRSITTFRRRGNHYVRSDEVHRLHLFPPRSFAAELREAGFRVSIRRRYGKMELGAGHAAFIARRPVK